MERSFTFDLGAVLRPTTMPKIDKKSHKSKPIQFDSVAVGTQVRLESSLQIRKSCRLVGFDTNRNLPTEDPVTDPKLAKIEHRRQQLQKWKLEKEKKKKEEAAAKKKPFLVGVAHASLKFIAPPPPPKPNCLGRVTRSKGIKLKEVHTSPKQRNARSFAPENAVFRPPDLKSAPKLTKCVPPTTKTKRKEKIMSVTFEPVEPNNSVRQTRSHTVNTRSSVKESNNKAKTQNETMKKSTYGKQVKTTTYDIKTNQLTSSSSSEVETQTATKLNKIIKTKKIKTSVNPEPIKKKLILPSTSSSDETKAQEDSLSSESGVKLNNLIIDCTVVLEQSPLIKVKTDMMKTPNMKVPRSESNSEEKLRSPNTPNRSPLTPEQIELAKSSPLVTVSRGKDNARREMKWKIEEGLLDDQIENDGVEYFRQQLAFEKARLTARCDLWEKILEQKKLPESVQEQVLAAVGQSRLLVSQKLKQFGNLVDTAAAPPPGAPLVTTDDLRGYWDVAYMQVKNIDMRFKKLEELREMNWVDESQAPAVKATVVTRASPAKRPVKKSAATSRLRDVIAAARRAKKQQDGPPSVSTSASEAPNEKTFEAGFFTVRSPVQSPVRTPCKQTLLKAVLSSEAKKTASQNSSFAMLRASILGKSTEIEGIDVLPKTPQMTPINLNATPARSILKSANTQSAVKNMKSVKLVLFDDTTEESSSSSDENNARRRLCSVDDGSVMNNTNGVEESTSMDSKENRGVLTRQNAFDASSTPKKSVRKSIKTPQSEGASESKRMTLRPRPALRTPEVTNTTPQTRNIGKSVQRSAKKT